MRLREAQHVRLASDSGDTIAGALLSSEHELWDASRRRLTILLDPARIKRGLAGHRIRAELSARGLTKNTGPRALSHPQEQTRALGALGHSAPSGGVP